ncbi:hypothetical protein FHS16_000595 [Paenibacillus endophyticus]|uniref:Uncharacterized protein n=1 Tax=Paenibacillus endophyticus TaxID=1294268 RepID=A0A7W5C3S0_9BACL|nr:hypothetical protein [Paenibacillus endophyticus]
MTTSDMKALEYAIDEITEKLFLPGRRGLSSPFIYRFFLSTINVQRIFF